MKKSLVVLAAVTLLCSGCLLDSKDDYVYSVTTSDGCEVMVTAEGFGQQQVMTPWHSPTFERADGGWIFLSAQRWDAGRGYLTVSVTKNGKVWLSETSIGEYVIASVEGSAH